MLVQVREAFQGIKPNVGSNDYVLAAYKEARQAIHNADVHQPEVIPNVPGDAYMLEHAKKAAAGHAPAKRARWPFSAGKKDPGAGAVVEV